MLKESFKEKTNTGISTQRGSKYPEKVNNSKNDTLVDQHNSELNHFINTSIIAKRAEANANIKSGVYQIIGKYLHKDPTA